MSRVIRYTNPTATPGGHFKCAVCKSVYDSEPQARGCAEADHKAKGRS